MAAISNILGMTYSNMKYFEIRILVNSMYQSFP